MEQTCKAADELEVSVVTGHTGSYEGMSTLVGVCTAYGTVDKERLITPAGAVPGDFILCTKPIGLEVAVNLASTNRGVAEKLFGTSRAKKLAELVTMQSCVKEALTLAKMGGVHAMHDATEGGLTAALNEVAEASKVGFEIEFEKVPAPNEVLVLQKHLDLSDGQLMSLSSTGTILAAVSPEAKDNVEESLRLGGVEARFLGVFTKKNRCLLVKNGRETPFPRRADDPYERILSTKL
jgi:hydrogenase maturation factor